MPEMVIDMKLPFFGLRIHLHSIILILERGYLKVKVNASTVDTR
jgi:hypothetical protein